MASDRTLRISAAGFAVVFCLVVALGYDTLYQSVTGTTFWAGYWRRQLAPVADAAPDAGVRLLVYHAFFYLAQQNYTVFNGFGGFSKVAAPEVFGIDLKEPVPFYFVTLACALAGYGIVRHLVTAPFGIALQGIRDNPRRMASLGYHVTAHRVAAYAVAGLLAAVGGVLLVWYNGRISPGTVNLAQMISILIVAVLGGMKHPVGAFIGALVYVLLQNFAIDLFVRERFNLVIGGVFLAIVLFSPDGLLGLWAKLRSRLVKTKPSLNQGDQP